MKKTICVVEDEKDLNELVKRYQISPELIQVEVTESAFGDESERVYREVQKLHEAGYTVLLDEVSFTADFGKLYTLKISGDKSSGYQAVFESTQN